MKPDIFLFNPTCELAVANGSANYMAPAQLREFESQLSTLPWLLAQPKDTVLVDQLPNQQFTDQLKNAGFILPDLRLISSFLEEAEFIPSEKGFLFPWGWSPSAHKQLLPLKSGCCSEFLSSPVAQWRNIHRELYSRKSSLDILTQIVTENISSNILSVNDLPEICTNHGQIIALQQKWDNVVVKAPWSASGRGLQILRTGEYNQTNRQVIAGYFKNQDYVLAGPWHNKVLDLSFQFFSYGDGRIGYKGLTSFSTDQAGRYTGNSVQELPADLHPELKEFLLGNIDEVRDQLQKALSASGYSTEYYGWLGVDALIFESPGGKLKFHPCLEINCRFTMGAIALSLRTHLQNRSTGEFRIFHGKKGQFHEFCEEQMKNEPLITDSGKIVEGFLPMTPVVKDCSFGSWISISKNERMKK